MSGLKHEDQHGFLFFWICYDGVLFGTGIKDFELPSSGLDQGKQKATRVISVLVLVVCIFLAHDAAGYSGTKSGMEAGDPRWFFRLGWDVSLVGFLGFDTRVNLVNFLIFWHHPTIYWECQEYIISKYIFFQVMFKIHPTREISASPAGEPQLLLHREPRPTCGRGGNRSDGLYGMVVMAHDLGWFIFFHWHTITIRPVCFLVGPWLKNCQRSCVSSFKHRQSMSILSAIPKIFPQDLPVENSHDWIWVLSCGGHISGLKGKTQRKNPRHIYFEPHISGGLPFHLDLSKHCFFVL